MARTVGGKMGLTEDRAAPFREALETALNAIDPPSVDVASELAGAFDSIHLFARTQTELDDTF